MILAAYYESEPRVVVDLDPGAFWYRTWGRNLSAFATAYSQEG